MQETIAIRADQKLPHSEDFEFLRKAGITLIQKLSGNDWTDYNSHDPGITLLEAICYALTDLGYRASFDIKDLLAREKQEDNPDNLFYTARQALPSGPLTLLDFRKLIIDTEDVKNAWIETSNDYEIFLYLKASAENNLQTYELSYDESAGEPLRLKGLYKVVVEFEESSRGKKEEEILRRIKEKLNIHRGLCEDFVSVSSVEYEGFTMEAELQVNEGADIEKINAQVFQLVQNMFSPSINFYTLPQMLERYTVEEIFEGPSLKHGFIDSKELQRSGRVPDIHLSDIIHKILKIEGVIAVKKCAFPVGSQSPFSEFTEWIREETLASEKLVRLDIDNSVIRFFRNGDKYRQHTSSIPDKERVKALYNFLQSEKGSTKIKDPLIDLNVPQGEWMNVGDYFPLQYSLPACYGVTESVIDASPDGNIAGITNVSKSAADLINGLSLRKKQVLQLKGYLMVFEQILADFLAQLANLRELFSIDTAHRQTYYSQPLKNLYDAEYLIKAGNEDHAASVNIETEKEYFRRKNAILDHLLARYGEEMNKYSFYVKNLSGADPARLLAAKEAFLLDYVQLSNYKGKGFNYADSTNIWDTDNVASIKKRICRALDIRDYRTTYTTCDWITIEKKEEGLKQVRYIVLVKDSASGKVLLESNPYQTESEVKHIMSYIIEQGSHRNNYEIDARPGKYNYQLRMKNQENGFDVVAIKNFTDKNELEESFANLVGALGSFSQNENFHLLEHILLRPKIDPQIDTGKESTSEGSAVTLLSITNPLPATEITGVEQPAFPYKFKIQKQPDHKDKSRSTWKLSLMRDTRTEALIVEEDFALRRSATERIVRIRQAGADRINYSEKENADGYWQFEIKDQGRVLAAGKKSYRKKEDMIGEIKTLVDYFSFELNLMNRQQLDEDAGIAELSDPYSFQLTVFIPDWPTRFRDPSFKYLLEKAIYSEMPAHILPRIYWLDYKTMKDFEKVYKAWLEEMVRNAIPDTTTVNNVIFALNEIRKTE